MLMKQYLNELAERTCARPLPLLTSLEALEQWRRERRARFMGANGMDRYLEQARTPLNTRVTGVYERDGYTIETLYFESLPGLFVAGNLYVPRGTTDKAPAILYLNGHSPVQKVYYQSQAQELLRLGFVVLIIDTIQMGENFGYHHGTTRYGWYHWISKGYTPIGAEVWNGIRAIDLLSERPEVDPERIGVTGNSGGGSIAWWLPVCDDRVRATAPSCGTGTTSSHVLDNTVDTHCDCFFPVNPEGWSLTEMYALVAPRPVLIAASAQDLYFTKASIHEVYDKLRAFYAGFGAEAKVGLTEFEGPHGYDTRNRKNIASWFLRHLAGREMNGAEEAVFDAAYEPEHEETLRAFKDGIPGNDESSTVQDWFVPAHVPSPAASAAELERQRLHLRESLRRDTFAFFPDRPNAVEADVFHRWQGGDSWTAQFRYATEPGWRLQGILSGKLGQEPARKMPTGVFLRGLENYAELGSRRMLHELSPAWLRARLDVRGTGDTAWAPQFANHLRRSAALMGRTLPAIMVWDALMGIAALRSMPEVDPDRIVLAARGEMAVVALYAALLDGNIFALVLEDPVGTLNQPDDRLSMPIELTNALRYTDLPHTAALLYPMPIVFVKQRPADYRYTELQYRKLGAPGGTWRVDRPEQVLDQLLHR